MNSIHKTVNGVNICVDPKVELMGILITLSDESSIDQYKRLFNFGNNNKEYINIIKSEFSYLTENGFINRFNAIKNKYRLHYQEPIKLMLMLDDEFNSQLLAKYYNRILEQDFYDYIRELKEIYESPKFIDFYNNNIARYEKWIKSLVPLYEKYNISNIISSYCGEKYKNLKLHNNLIAFETNGGYGICINNEAHYCLRTFSSRNQQNDIFVPRNVNELLPLVIHEFLHSIINPITTKYNIFTNESNYFEKNDMLSLSGYGNDYCLINETIIRAITIKLYGEIMKEIDIDELLNKEYTQGFIYIKDVYKKLSEYENNRQIYLDIDSFYNFIAEVIINDKEKNIKR